MTRGLDRVPEPYNAWTTIGSARRGGDAYSRLMPEQHPVRSLVQLTEPECLEFLATMPVGRIAYVVHDRISVIPVNYLLDGRDVLARTTPDGDLMAAARGNATAALEVDDLVAWSRSGWSVLIRGRLREETDATRIRAVLDSGLRPWAIGAREHVVRLVGAEVTGRRIEPGKGGVIFYPG